MMCILIKKQEVYNKIAYMQNKFTKILERLT